MKKLLLFPLITFIILALIFSGKALAAVANPNSTTIGDTAVFPDVLKTGDQLWFIRYNIDYTTEPSEPASTTFHMAIYDTDGTTLLFTRPVTDYGNDVIGIYLDSTQALTWDAAYQVRIQGNPAIFDPLVEGVNKATRTLGAGDFWDNENLVGFLTDQAQILENLTGIDYINSSDRITDTGAAHFNNGIPGITGMAPAAFVTSTSQVSLPDTHGSVSYSDIIAGNTSPTFGDAASGIAGLTGFEGNWGQYALVGLLGIIILGGVFYQHPGAGVAVAGISAFLILPWAASVGWVSFTLWAIIAFVILAIGAVVLITRVFST